MSTKTSFKRIALVAASALAIAGFSAVPANALGIGTTTLAVDELSVTTPFARVAVGSAATTTFGASFSLVGNGTKVGVVLVSASVPGASAITVTDNDGAATDTIATNTGKAAAITSTTVGTNVDAGDKISIVPAAAATADTTNIAGTLSFTPDVEGLYVVTLTGTTLAAPGVANAVTATFTVLAGKGTVASPIFISTASTVDADGASAGYTATALSAITSSTAPGVAYTGGLIATSVASLTVPAGAALALTLDDVAGGYVGVEDWADLAINGQVVAAEDGAATDGDIAYTVPATMTAGTYSASITYYQSSTTRSAATLTTVIPFTLVVSSAATAIAALDASLSSLSVMSQADHATCAAGASAVHKAAVAAVAKTSGYYTSGHASSKFIVCLNARNGLDAAVTPATVFLSTTKGVLADSATGAVGTAPGISATPGAGVTKTDLSGDSVQTGATTITAVVTYGTSVITLSTPFTWYGKLASLTLANATYAGNAKVPAADADAITIQAKDSSGNVIPYAAWTDTATAGKVTTSITDASAADLKISSSKGNGATVSARGDSNTYATVVTAGDAQASLGAAAGVNYGGITITCGTAKYEKIDLTIYGYSSVAAAAGATDTQTIVSNSVSYSCSSPTAAAIAVKPVATTVALSGTTKVDVLVTDENGLIVPDGTAIAVAANGNGNVVLGGDVITTNGGLDTTATFIGGPSNNTATITAVAGAVTGTATVTVGDGSEATTSGDLALDAANAATDAANNAYDEAQNATQAASDALAAVTALAAQVKSLIASVKKAAAAIAAFKKKTSQ